MNVNEIFSKRSAISGAAIAILAIAVIVTGVMKKSPAKGIATDVPSDQAAAVELISADMSASYVPPVEINGTTFRLSSFNNVPLATSTNYTLTFKGDKLSAKFCNGMSGTYTLANGIIKADLASTKMFCGEPADIMALESSFGSVISSPASLFVQGTTVIIRGSNGEKFAFDVIPN